MLEEIISRLERIETKLAEALQQRQAKEFYSTAEVAEIVGRSEFTVREWCRLKRIQAVKRPNGIGRLREWRISHEELQRLLSHGPQPLRAAGNGDWQG